MNIVQLNDLNIKNKIYDGKRSSVYILEDGRILKIYKRDYIELLRKVGIDIEKKMADSFVTSTNDNIIKPSCLVYDKQEFVGDISIRAKGVDYLTFLESLNIEERTDLKLFATLYSKLESIIRTSSNIVFPDICSYENIFISNSDCNIELIDYEGFQVDNYPTLSFSRGLGDRQILMKSKKYTVEQGITGKVPLYTKELDIRSLIYFYFRSVFNIDLRYDRDIEVIARSINLNNPDIMYKVWALFEEDVPNEWLGDDVFEIATDYKLEILPNYRRRLKHK